MSCTTCTPVINVPQCTEEIIIGQIITPGTYVLQITNTILNKTVQIQLAALIAGDNIVLSLLDIQEFISPNFIYDISIAEGPGQPTVPFNVDATEVECIQIEFSECLDGEFANVVEASIEVHLQ